MDQKDLAVGLITFDSSPEAGTGIQDAR